MHGASVSESSAAAPRSFPVVARPAVPTFDEFYASERAHLVAVLWALTGSRGVAEDLAHDAFVRAFVHWSDISRYDRPDQWLRRVALNLASNRWRRMRTERKTVERLSRGRADVVDAVPERDQELWEVVRGLPSRQAQTLVLHAIDGYSSAEIAALLCCGDGTVRTHLRRAREHAQRSLRDLDPCPEPLATAARDGVGRRGAGQPTFPEAEVDHDPR